MNKWTKIGSIGVDAGIVWIGDPCYIKKNYFLPWDKFCDKLPHDGSAKEFKEGICVPSGYGDGEYNVYARYGRDGVIQGILIDFADLPEENVVWNRNTDEFQE